jgi:LysR family transcriptional regulator for metE and metH
VVRIASGAYGCHGWLPAFLAELATGDARYNVEILDNGSGVPLPNAVVDGAVDVAIFGGEVADRRLLAHRLFADELVALLPARHRLATKRHLEAADFAEEVFLSYSTVPERGLEDHRFFRPAKANPRRWIRAGNVEMIVEMVRRGLGVSILSRWAVEPLLASGGLTLSRLTGAGLPANWHAVVRASELKDSASAQLAECLAAWCGREFAGWRGGQRGARRTSRPRRPS